MSDDESTIAIRFGQSRATGGEDVGGLIRAAWPEADVRAELDGAGAVTGYVVTLHFEDADAATEAVFRLRDHLLETGIPFEVL